MVRIWDQRRLVVPFSTFISQSFQNWSRTTTELLATVFIYVGYNVPMAELREQFGKVLRECDKWDGRVEVVQVEFFVVDVCCYCCKQKNIYE